MGCGLLQGSLLTLLYIMLASACVWIPWGLHSRDLFNTGESLLPAQGDALQTISVLLGTCLASQPQLRRASHSSCLATKQIASCYICHLHFWAIVLWFHWFYHLPFSHEVCVNFKPYPAEAHPCSQHLAMAVGDCRAWINSALEASGVAESQTLHKLLSLGLLKPQFNFFRNAK